MREARAKLSLRPNLPGLQRLLERVRALPWPGPLQRFTTRGLSRLKARLPGLAELLDGLARPAHAHAHAHAQPATSVPAPPAPSSPRASLVAMLAAPDYERRLKAAHELGQLQDPAALAPLMAALRDPSVEVACTAAGAIAGTGSAAGERAQEALLAVLDNEDGYYHTLTRAAAAYGLGHRALHGAAGHGVLARLEQALLDRDAEVSIAAIGALSERFPESAGAALCAVVENRDGFFVPVTRLAAARALGRLGPAQHARVAELCAREQDEPVRSALEAAQRPGAPLHA